MFRAGIIGLLLAGLSTAAFAAAGPRAVDDMPGQASAGPRAINTLDCGAENLLRRLSGCTALIVSDEASGDALARAYRNRGMAFFSLGEQRRAIADFDRAIEITGGTAALYLARGIAWQRLGQHTHALDDLIRALELDPDNATAYGSLGIAWENLGKNARALDAYHHALDLEPDNAVVLNNYGNVLARTGRVRQAIAAYDRALRLKPDYATAYYNRAGEHCLRGQAEPAVADYLDAIRLGDRQRVALRAFLSRQGYLDSARSAASPTTGELESALRRWSRSACATTPTEAARPEDDAGTVALKAAEKTI